MRRPESGNDIPTYITAVLAAGVAAVALYPSNADGATKNTSSITSTPIECVRYITEPKELRVCVALLGKISFAISNEYRFGISPNKSVELKADENFDQNVRGPLGARIKKMVDKWPKENRHVKNKSKIIQIDLEENGRRAVVEVEKVLTVTDSTGTRVNKKGTEFDTVCLADGIVSKKEVLVESSTTRDRASKFGCTAFAIKNSKATTRA